MRWEPLVCWAICVHVYKALRVHVEAAVWLILFFFLFASRTFVPCHITITASPWRLPYVPKKAEKDELKLAVSFEFTAPGEIKKAITRSHCLFICLLGRHYRSTFFAPGEPRAGPSPHLSPHLGSFVSGLPGGRTWDKLQSRPSKPPFLVFTGGHTPGF